MSKGYDVPTSIAVDDTVRYLNKGWGTVTDLWEDKKTGKTKFKVLFEVGLVQHRFYYPDIFDDGRMIKIKG